MTQSAEKTTGSSKPAVVHTDQGNGPCRVVRLVGEVDLQSAGDVERTISELAPQADEIVVDLSAVTFMDSSGLAAMLRGNIACAAASCSLRANNESQVVARLLDLSGLRGQGPFAPAREKGAP